MPERIEEVFIEDEMRRSYIDYAMSVIVGRALPDVRDGLKPVHRRILYAMLGLGLLPDKPFKKCATVVGEVLGKYHPHGDMAVYDALVRMAQNFSLRYPLIEGQGNFGSIDGDPAAAYRYTEARLSKIAMEILEDIDKNTVDFVPNFDGKLQEPVVLPSMLPQFLVNGSSGIAVGMATNVPPHNIGEIIDALIFLIDNPSAKDEEILEIVRGPDFPTGGLILGKEGIKETYLTGKGRILVRARIQVEEGQRRQKKIVITEIPYQINKGNLIEKIAQLVKDKKIEDIADLRDESDREGMRIVIEVKRGANEKVIINQLLHHTPLQVTFGAILLALVNGEPKILTLKQMLQEFLKHREEVITRKTKFLLEKAEKRAHILEGLKKALQFIDEVISIIKKSKEPKEAKEKLIQRFELTEIQAQAILDMRLQQLTRLEQNKLDEEYLSLIKEIERLKSILEKRSLLLDEMKKEFLELKEKYRDDRLTTIVEELPEEFTMEDLIQKEKVVVILTDSGYIKRMPASSLRIARRGTVGRSGLNLYEEDFPRGTLSSETHDYILFFSKKGFVFAIKTYELPEGSFQSKGKPLHTLISLSKQDKIVDTMNIKDFSDKEYVFLVTKNGIVKRTSLYQFRHAGIRGIRAITMPESDELVDALLVKESNEVVIAKKNGNAVRFTMKEVRSMGRTAYGVAGTKVQKNDSVCKATKIEKGELLLTVTENGFGKRFDPFKIRKSHRGAMGVRIQKIDQKTGKVVGIHSVREEDSIFFLTLSGNITRIPVREIRITERGARGVILVKLKENDRIVDACIVHKEEDIE